MNPDIKTRWLAALRDPAAKQGKGRLGRVNGERCCLGVLCDIAVQDGVIDLPIPNSIPERGKVASPTAGPSLVYGPNGGYLDYLPREVVEWADADDVDQQSLGRRNDGGSSFAQIADWIEEKY